MKIKVIIVEPNKLARVEEIDNNLKNLQSIAGGYIECIYPFEDNAAIICNEEGKIQSLPLNRAIYDGNEIIDIIAGTFIITGLTEDDFGSLTDEQTEKHLNQFRYPEVFISVSGKIKAFKVIK